jgi:NTP pyrophosphatase (non-canonical NTP hydrolase)
MPLNFEALVLLVEIWGEQRGIIESSTPESQFLKTVSEIGELSDALAKGTQEEVIDSLGDVLVTLILVARLKNLSLTSCLQSAYDEIVSRKGKMVNGVFVKEET